MEIAFYGFFVVLALVITGVLVNIDRERNKRAEQRKREKVARESLMTWEEELLDRPRTEAL